LNEINEPPVTADGLNFENDEIKNLKKHTFISLCGDHKKCYFFRLIIIYDRKSINLSIIAMMLLKN